MSDTQEAIVEQSPLLVPVQNPPVVIRKEKRQHQVTWGGVQETTFVRTSEPDLTQTDEPRPETSSAPADGPPRPSTEQEVDEVCRGLKKMISQLQELRKMWDNTFDAITCIHPLRHTIRFDVATGPQRLQTILQYMPKVVRDLQSSFKESPSRFRTKQRTLLQNFNRCSHIAKDMAIEYARLKQTSPPPEEGESKLDLAKILQASFENTTKVMEELERVLNNLRILTISDEDFILRPSPTRGLYGLSAPGGEDHEPGNARKFFKTLAAVSFVIIVIVLIDVSIITYIKTRE